MKIDFATSTQIGHEPFSGGKFLQVSDVMRRCLSLSETTERPSQADSKLFMLGRHTVMYVRYVSKKYLIE